MTGPVVIASGLLFAISVLMAVWGASTLARTGDFRAATDRFTASYPDFDVTGWFPFAFVTAAVVSLAFAVTFSALGLVILRGVAMSRWVTIFAVCAALPFVYLAYVDYGTPYLFPGTLSGAAGPMRALTPWRYTGWYYDLTIGLGVLIMTGLVLVIALLVLPSSKSHFQRNRMS
jgi:hypothetical protein